MSYEWTSRVDAALVELEQKPQFAAALEFPWKELQENLASHFARASLALDHKEKGWEEKPVLAQDSLVATMSLDPLQTPVYFAIEKGGVHSLMKELLEVDKEPLLDAPSALVQGFYRYLVLEVVDQLRELKFLSKFSPQLKEIGPPPSVEEPCFVSQVQIKVDNAVVWCEVLLPASFRDQIKSFVMQEPPPPLSPQRAQKLMTELGLQVGYASLSYHELKSVEKGDFILLDHCTFDPDEHEGGVLLTMGEHALFRGRLKDGGVKLSKIPAYEEVETMDEEIDDIYGDEEDEELFDEFEEEDDDEEEKALPTEEAEAPSESPLTPFSVEKVPIKLTVEVARLQMSASELMNLSAGSVLPLDVSVEEGVDLVVSGKKVGSGELVRLGDALGVRVTKL